MNTCNNNPKKKKIFRSLESHWTAGICQLDLYALVSTSINKMRIQFV